MKRTVYFASTGNHQPAQFDRAIKEAVDKRDAWLEDMKLKIGKIEKEDIKPVTNNSYGYVIIQLSYYPK